jgi:hypothetical protein
MRCERDADREIATSDVLYLGPVPRAAGLARARSGELRVTTRDAGSRFGVIGAAIVDSWPHKPAAGGEEARVLLGRIPQPSPSERRSN